MPARRAWENADGFRDSELLLPGTYPCIRTMGAERWGLPRRGVDRPPSHRIGWRGSVSSSSAPTPAHRAIPVQPALRRHAPPRDPQCRAIRSHPRRADRHPRRDSRRSLRIAPTMPSGRTVSEPLEVVAQMAAMRRGLCRGPWSGSRESRRTCRLASVRHEDGNRHVFQQMLRSASAQQVGKAVVSVSTDDQEVNTAFRAVGK